uniref:translation initiation factor IF-2-like n=1 Tax=Nyctereutes procyonoides TaxID=34880 RepID=UPI002444F8B2|nr:translation initiation factor IF-2-like [Nyctereutes procyonoides]
MARSRRGRGRGGGRVPGGERRGRVGIAAGDAPPGCPQAPAPRPGAAQPARPPTHRTCCRSAAPGAHPRDGSAPRPRAQPPPAFPPVTPSAVPGPRPAHADGRLRPGASSLGGCPGRDLLRRGAPLPLPGDQVLRGPQAPCCPVRVGVSAPGSAGGTSRLGGRRGGGSDQSQPRGPDGHPGSGSSGTCGNHRAEPAMGGAEYANLRVPENPADSNTYTGVSYTAESEYDGDCVDTPNPFQNLPSMSLGTAGLWIPSSERSPWPPALSSSGTRPQPALHLREAHLQTTSRLREAL